MKTTDLTYFKDKLLKEKTLLEEEMKTVGRNNTAHPEEWEATVDDAEIDTADDNEVADKLGELEEHQAILRQLSPQSQNVDKALEKIEKGTYGICEVCEEAIEHNRLEAVPSASSCIKHMNDGQKKTV